MVHWASCGYFKHSGGVTEFLQNGRSYIILSLMKVYIFYQQYFYKNQKQIMNTQQAKDNSKQGKSNWLLSILVNLSFVLENIPIRSSVQITTFFLTQVLLDVLFPCFMIVSGLEHRLEFLAQISNLFFLWGSQQQNNPVLEILIFELLFCVVSVPALIALVSSRSKTIQQVGLYWLKLCFCFSTPLLVLSTQTLLYLIKGDSNALLPTLGKTICILNIFLVFLFCIFYKVVAHTYSTSAPNALCSRFDLLNIVRAVGTKILASLVLLVMGIRMLWPDSTSNTTIVFTTLQSLVFVAALTQVRNQVRYFTYAHPFSQKVKRACLILEISCVFNTLLCLTTGLRIVAQNYLYSMVSLYIFLALAIRAFVETRSKHYQLKSQQQLKSEEEAILFILQLNKIFQVDNIKNAELNQLQMVRNLYKKHVETCLTVDCYCKHEKIQEKNADQMIDIYQLLALGLMERFCAKYCNSFEVVKFVLSAKLHTHKNFVGTSHMSKIYQNGKRKQISFWEKLFFGKYTLALQKYLDTNSNYTAIARTELCLQSQGLNQKLMSKIRQVVQLRTEFWSRLSKGLINEQIQEKVDKQMSTLKQIYDLNESIIEWYYNSPELVNLLIGYEKNILMKDRISKQLLQCIKKFQINHLKHIKAGLKINKKQKVEEMMYEKLSCTIEVSIDQREIGHIINTSKNVIDVFGYSQREILGININKLMPKKMQKEHDYLIKTWTQRCSWTNIGQLRNIFCMSKTSICFSSRMYLKPILRMDCVNMIGSFFKDNDQDYMIIDSDDLIVAAGSNFINMLGSSIVNLPIDFVMQGSKDFHRWVAQKDKTIHTLNFYSTKGNKQIFQQYHEEKCVIDTTTRIKQKIYDLRNEAQYFSLKFLAQEMEVGRVKFKIIKLEGLNQRRSQRLIESLKIISSICQQEPKDLGRSFNPVNESNVFINFNPSVSSSNTNQPTATHNVIYKMEKIFYAKSQIYDRRSLTIAFVVVLVCLVGVFFDFGKIYINEKGFQEMQELFFADGACSDNLQLSMFIYNNAMMLNGKLMAHQQLTPEQIPNAVLQMNLELFQQKYYQKYLDELISAQIMEYNKKVTSLTNLNMFRYQNNLVKWISAEKVEETIQTTKFMANFLYLSDQVIRLSAEATDLLASNASSKQKLSQIRSQLEYFLSILHDNFPELEAMNSDNLNYYATILLQTKNTIKLFSYIKMVGSIIVFFIILFVLNQHHQHRHNQDIQIYEQYRHLTMDCAIGLLRYYLELRKVIKSAAISLAQKKLNFQANQNNSQVMIKLNEINDDYTLSRLKNENRQTTGLKILIEKSKFPVLKILYIGIFLCTIGMNLLMQTSEQKILSKSQQIVNYINNLMDSENQVIGTYFTLKSRLMMGNMPTQEELNALFQKVNNVQVEFTKVAYGSLTLFADYDPSYVTKMEEILTKSVCELTQQDLPQEFYKKCVEDQQMKIITHGVINGMNYFGRKIQNMLMQQIKNENLQEHSLSQVDQTLFHMFKIYQQTQAEITDSLGVAIVKQKTEYILEITIELAVLMIFLGYAFLFYAKENKETATRIGKILLLPVEVIKGDLKILRNFQKIVDFTNVKQK